MTGEDDTEADLFLRDLQEVGGQRAVDALIESCGGTHVYIPARRFQSENSRLVEALGGLDAANAIIDGLNARGRYGIGILIPLAYSGVRASTAQRIHNLLLSGEHSIATIAGMVGIHEITVYRHKSRLLEARILPDAASTNSATKQDTPLRSALKAALVESSSCSDAFLSELVARHRCSFSYAAEVRRQLAKEGLIRPAPKGGRYV